MFAYCNNNPVNLCDYFGNKPQMYTCSDDGSTKIHAYSVGKAVSVSIYNQTIYIDAYMTFHGPVDEQFLVLGIKAYWEGSYTYGKTTYNVVVNIHPGESSEGYTINVYTFEQYGRSLTIHCPFTWPSTKESTVVLYTKYYSKTGYAWTMAHEFGHCLGVGDYYAHSEANGFDSTFPSIMNTVGAHASTSDIIKVEDAHRYSIWQDWHYVGGL